MPSVDVQLSCPFPCLVPTEDPTGHEAVQSTRGGTQRQSVLTNGNGRKLAMCKARWGKRMDRTDRRLSLQGQELTGLGEAFAFPARS